MHGSSAVIGADADLDFLLGGGQMGARMRTHDWTASPLGHPRDWPLPLRSYVRLMLNAKQAMFIAWGPDLAFLYNDAYAPIFGDKHPRALGRPFAEVWADIWGQIKPLVDRTLAGEASWHEDLLIPMERHGYREEAWFTFSYTPVYDAGAVAGMFCAATETTGKVLAERRLATESERLKELFHQAPGFMCVLSGPDFIFEMANASYLRLVGNRDIIGKPLSEALPEVAKQAFPDLLKRVHATGEPFVGQSVPVRLQQSDGHLEERFLDFVYQPVRDADGRVSGVFVEGHDVTEIRRAEQHLRLLMNELNHRLKNTLTSVQAVVSQTLRRSASVEEAQDKITSRLKALGRAQDVLTRESWDGAPIRAAVEAAVAPLLGAEGRVKIHGPQLRLSPRAALSLSLGLHELATNAVKYGALKGESGTVEISWCVEDRNAEPRFTLVWQETGGPPVAPPSRTGFGTRLIERGLAAELAAEVRTDYAPSGIVFTLKTDLAEIQDRAEEK